MDSFSTGSWRISLNYLRFWTLIWFLLTSPGASGVSHHIECMWGEWVYVCVLLGFELRLWWQKMRRKFLLVLCVPIIQNYFWASGEVWLPCGLGKVWIRAAYLNFPLNVLILDILILKMLFISKRAMSAPGHQSDVNDSSFNNTRAKWLCLINSLSLSDKRYTMVIRCKWL